MNRHYNPNSLLNFFSKGKKNIYLSHLVLLTKEEEYLPLQVIFTGSRRINTKCQWPAGLTVQAQFQHRKPIGNKLSGNSKLPLPFFFLQKNQILCQA